MNGYDMLETTLCPPLPPALGGTCSPVGLRVGRLVILNSLLWDLLPNLTHIFFESENSPFRLSISFYKVANSENTIHGQHVTSSGSHSLKHEDVGKQTRALMPMRTQSQVGDW